MTFKLGDFVQNKIHKHTSLVCYVGPQIFGLIIEYNTNDTPWAKTFVARTEIPSELDKVQPTAPLISKARIALDTFNFDNYLDNLSYIEILSRLNEQEEGLKIENEL